MISITTLPADRQDVMSNIWRELNIELTCLESQKDYFECVNTSTFKYITHDELVKIQSYAMAKRYKMGLDMERNLIRFYR